jgi:hypothetical protein
LNQVCHWLWLQLVERSLSPPPPPPEPPTAQAEYWEDHQELFEIQTPFADINVDTVLALDVLYGWLLNQVCHWLWVMLVERLSPPPPPEPPVAQAVYREDHQELFEIQTLFVDINVDTALALDELLAG